MKGSTKVRIGMAAVGLGAVAFAALPANAQSIGTATISGSGTISPGLVTPPATSPQSFTFSSTTGEAATTDYTGAFSCTVTGNDTQGNLAQGQGGFSGTCTAGSSTESVSGSYTRTGGHVSLNGSFAPGSSPVNGTFSGHCSFELTSTPPANNAYAVQCSITLPATA